MKTAIGILAAALLLALQACTISRTGNSNYIYFEKYKSRIDSGSILLNAGPNFSVEKTLDGRFMRKNYHFETGRKTA